MNDVPAGWTKASVVEFASLHDNRRIPINAKQREAMQGAYPYYGANGLVDHVNDYLFEGEYTLLAEDGGYFDDPSRSVAYEASGKFWVNNHAHILEPLGGISNRFLRYALNAFDWMSYVGGSTRLKLTQGGLQQAQLTLPPLLEQRRIVAKIDSLSGKSKRARDHVDHIPRLVEKYKQGVLLAAYDGKFLPNFSRPVPLTTIGRMVRSLDQGWSPKCESEPALGPQDWAIIKTTAIQAIDFVDTENKRLPINLSPRSNIVIEPGDVLITRAGPRSRVAVACFVQQTRPRLMLCDKAYRLRVDPTVSDPAFLTYMLNAPQSLDVLERMKTGISDSGLNLTQSKFLELSIPKFSLLDQQEIVRRIKAGLSWINRVASEGTGARKLIDHLDQAILAKAFRGELVAQDPNDVPAAVLLERIRAERATATGTSPHVAAPRAKRRRGTAR
jgi:type I restriction enzyme S subunit